MMVVCRFNKAFFSVYGHRFYFSRSFSVHFFASALALLCFALHSGCSHSRFTHIHMPIEIQTHTFNICDVGGGCSTGTEHSTSHPRSGMRELSAFNTHTHSLWADTVCAVCCVCISERQHICRLLLVDCVVWSCWTEVWVCVNAFEYVCTSYCYCYYCFRFLFPYSIHAYTVRIHYHFMLIFGSVVVIVFVRCFRLSFSLFLSPFLLHRFCLHLTAC